MWPMTKIDEVDSQSRWDDHAIYAKNLTGRLNLE